ncbi:MAG: enoyl-CoA hydratase/isomerase family protein [Rhodobacteraceae bacterium]|nr:enoyl-CoA hydratase/isomerase family protein [Paracoccaceae bacterium]
MSSINLKFKESVAIITLSNAAKLNALTSAMVRELESHCMEVERRRETRAMILTGEGEKAFCVGADIAEWSAMTPADFARDWIRGGHRVFDRLARLSIPTVAALNGHAFGGGLELAAACDIRIMAPKARIALPEARVGIVPGWSGTQRLARLIPEPLMKEMALFGRQIGAERAWQAGFVSEVNEFPFECALQIAGSVSELSPRAVEIAKNMIHAGRAEDPAAMVDSLAAAAMGATLDKEEGVRAFTEKRPAKFTGE